MGDYPDYTTAEQIIGSDIMVPIDIQGAYIMMPVDIQAQYITLEIDIVAQTIGNLTIDIAAQTVGNLAVNIAAAAVTLNVSIASVAGGVTFNIGTITGTVTVSVTGTANIDIHTQSVSVKNQAEWAALTGVDKNFMVSGDNIAFGSGVEGTYVVTTGKTLYICGMSFLITAVNAADANANQIGMVLLSSYTPTIYLAYLGGNGGGGITFPKPLAVASGKTFSYSVASRANHYTNLRLTVWGYEV